MATESGAAFGQQLHEAAMNLEQLLGERRGGGRADGAARDDPVARSVGLDAAVAGALRPGIDAKDSHASEASISFSSMSKFDQTCCTSSWSSRASISLTICCAGLPSSFT